MDNIMVAVVLFVLMTFCLYGYNFPLKVLAVLHVFLSLPHMDLVSSLSQVTTLFLQYCIFVVLFTGCLNLVWGR